MGEIEFYVWIVLMIEKEIMLFLEYWSLIGMWKVEFSIIVMFYVFMVVGEGEVNWVVEVFFIVF